MGTIAKRDFSTSTANVSVYTSGTLAGLTAGDLLFVFGHATGSIEPAATGFCTASANGITFNMTPLRLEHTLSGNITLIWVADQLVPSSPAAMTISVNYSTDPGTGSYVAVGAVSGMSKTGLTAIKQSALSANLGANAAYTATFGTAVNTANPVAGGVGWQGTMTITAPPTGFTELDQSAAQTAPVQSFEWAKTDSGDTATAHTWSVSASSTRANVWAIEFDISSGGGGFTGVATLSGDGSLTTTQVPGPVVTSALSGTGSLTTTQAPGPVVTAGLLGAGTLTTTAPGGGGVGPISFVDAKAAEIQSSASSNITATGTLPTGHAANDLLLMAVHSNRGTTESLVSDATSAGWTLAQTVADGSETSRFYWKLDSGSESAPVAVFTNAGAIVHSIITHTAAYRGVDTGTPILLEDAVGEGTNTTTHSGPTLNNTDAGAWGVFMAAARQNATPNTWAPGSGLTERLDTDAGIATLNDHWAETSDTNGTVSTGNWTPTGTTGASTGTATMWSVLVKVGSATGFTGSATFSGSGTLSTTQKLGPTVAVTLSGDGTLTTVQVPRPVQTAVLSGSGTLATVQVPSPVQTAVLSGTGTLTTTAQLAAAGTATLSGSGALTAFRVYDATGFEWGSSATGTGWVNPTNATGTDDSTYATWTSSTANAVSNPLEVGFGTFSAVPSDAFNINVRVRVKGYWS